LRLDYETFKEIEGDLLRPLVGEGLDLETLSKLYQSKLVYLCNLRSKCFMDLNRSESPVFTADDLELIVKAIHLTQNHLRNLILTAMEESLSKRTA